MHRGDVVTRKGLDEGSSIARHCSFPLSFNHKHKVGVLMLGFGISTNNLCSDMFMIKIYNYNLNITLTISLPLPQSTMTTTNSKCRYSGKLYSFSIPHEGNISLIKQRVITSNRNHHTQYPKNISHHLWDMFHQSQKKIQIPTSTQGNIVDSTTRTPRGPIIISYSSHTKFKYAWCLLLTFLFLTRIWTSSTFWFW